VARANAVPVAPVHRFFIVPVYIVLSIDRPSAAPGSMGLARHVDMKIALVALFVIAALGGGYFAWTEFGGEATFLTGGDDELRYVEIERLTAPFIRNGEFVQYVLLDVSLELTDEPSATRVRRLTPRLRDAFLGELHRLARVRPAGQRLINLGRVKARLLAGADRVLGPNVVRDVLVQLAH
jgi:hypothetical protein